MSHPGHDEEIAGCVFCDIVGGRLGAIVVFEDEATLAFLDRRQPGWPRGAHVLVIPKAHVELVFDLVPAVSAHLMQSVVRVATAMRTVVAPDGVSIWSSNGHAAGQEVPHVHLHVLARYPDDGLLNVYPQRPSAPPKGALIGLGAKLTAALAPGPGAKA